MSLIPPKVCSYSCVYCQLGKTDQYSITPKKYYDRTKILADIEKHLDQSNVDYITFAGDGEPTLSVDLAWLLKKCKEEFSVPTAVITNSSLIYQSTIAEILQLADVVLPSIDAGCEETFKKINQPHKHLDFFTIIQGLINFSNNYNGEIWTETMLVKDYNDSIEEINKISNIITYINPVKRFIMAPTRPPQLDIRKPDAERMLYAQKLISEVPALDYSETGSFNSYNFKNLTEALNTIAARHPLRLKQAESIAKNFDEDLSKLIQSNKFIQKIYNDDIFIIPSSLKNSRGENEP